MTGPFLFPSMEVIKIRYKFDKASISITTHFRLTSILIEDSHNLISAKYYRVSSDFLSSENYKSSSRLSLNLYECRMCILEGGASERHGTYDRPK